MDRQINIRSGRGRESVPTRSKTGLAKSGARIPIAMRPGASDKTHQGANMQPNGDPPSLMLWGAD